MADSKDRISAAAEADQPNPGAEKIVDASDADIALAAMGYKPVSCTHGRPRAPCVYVSTLGLPSG